MTKGILSIVAGVLLFVGGWFTYEWYQDQQRAKRTAAEVKLDAAGQVVAAGKDSVRRAIPGVAHADSALTGILRRPSPTPVRPKIIVDTVAGVIDSALWIRKSSYDTLASDFEQLRVAAIAYRDSSRTLLVRYPKLIADQDSVIKYQRVLIDTPKPRRNLGFGLSAGYGAVLNAGKIVAGPSVNVGVSYSF